MATPSLQFEFDRGIISDTANFTIQHGGNTTRIPMSLITDIPLLYNYSLNHHTFETEGTYQIGVEIEDIAGNRAKVPNVYVMFERTCWSMAWPRKSVPLYHN